MAKRRPAGPGEEKLDAIRSALQDLFILQAKLAGMNKGRVRAVLGVDNSKVSRLWKEIPAPK